MKKFKRIAKRVELTNELINGDNLIIKTVINNMIDNMKWGGNYQITVDKFNFNGLNYETTILLDYMEEVEEERKIKSVEIKEINNSEILAFVDGSFDKDKKLCGSGIVIVENLNSDKPIDTINFSTKDLYNQWNIQGECEACLGAIEYAIKNNYNKVTIYYDYQGIGSWAKREWKAKNDYTKSYVERFNKLKEYINVEFVKVKGHSNNQWNDEADRLARISLGK